MHLLNRFWAFRGLLVLIAATVGASCAATESATTPAKRPNIIFILADDLGYGDLGVYGSKHIRTPNLDRLAKEGTQFMQAYAGSSACAPSRCVLMTGLHTGHATIRDNSPRVGGKLEPYDNGREGSMRLSMTEKDVTVATLLKRAGYATGISGKWGLGEEGSNGTPTKHGFDEWLGYLNQNHAEYYYTSYLDTHEGRRPLRNGDGTQREYSNDLMADFMIDFVRRHREGPFFLYLPFTIPHERMEVPELGDYAARDWPEDVKIYAAMVTRLDAYVGRLTSELEKLGIAKDTLIFFTSDNGPAPKPRSTFMRSAAHLRDFKFSPYEGGLRVPMIVRWPGQVPAGRKSEDVWGFVDFLPTCMELAGGKTPAGSDGQSVAGLLRGKSSAQERSLYWEIPKAPLQQAARIGRWKGIRNGLDGAIELYDLVADPSESKNVADQFPAQLEKMKRFLDSSHTPSPHWPDRSS